MSRWRAPGPKSSPYITVAGYRKLESEVQQLWTRRAETVKHLAAAAAEGDRSENAEYIYRKKELREIDRRLGYLQRRLPKLTIVNRAPDSADRVYFGAWVEVADTADVITLHRIVGSDEIDHHARYISIDAPLAQALLKRRLDDEIVVTTVSGVHRYTVVDIRYEQPAS